MFSMLLRLTDRQRKSRKIQPMNIWSCLCREESRCCSYPRNMNCLLSPRRQLSREHHKKKKIHLWFLLPSNVIRWMFSFPSQNSLSQFPKLSLNESQHGKKNPLMCMSWENLQGNEMVLRIHLAAACLVIGKCINIFIPPELQGIVTDGMIQNYI